MTEPRLPASSQGAESGTDERATSLEIAAESGADQRIDRRGMLPRENGVEAQAADEDLALLLAEQIYPTLTHIDQITSKQEKAWWTLVAGQILRGHEAVRRYVESFSQVFQASVDASVADTLRRGAAEELERQERRAREIEIFKANLLLLAQQGALEQKRWNMEETERLMGLYLEATERMTRTRNRDRRENLVIGMATTIFLCAFAAFVVGLASGQPWIVGSSGITGIAALIAAVKLLADENKS